MKTVLFTVSIRMLAVALLLNLVASTAMADPSPDEVLKFAQEPMIELTIAETSFFGHDEESHAGLVGQNGSTNAYAGNLWMADDFADTVSADIVHVEWWGSYMGPEGPYSPVPGTKFLIEFLADDPVGPEGPDPNNTYSVPAQILSAEVVSLDPAGGHPAAPGLYTESVVPGSSPTEPVFHYNAELKYPFPQEAHTVYWIKIVALAIDPPPPKWGWHNRDYTIMNPYASPLVTPGEMIIGVVPPSPSGVPVWHFQDDAVQGQGAPALYIMVDTNTDQIVFLQEPLGTNHCHEAFYTLEDGPIPIDTLSKDLAFRLYYRPERPLEPKWSQPLDEKHGIDIGSYISENEFAYIADDFVSDGRPIAGIRWWGSYLNYMTNQPGPVDPPSGPEHPEKFYLDWWKDTPAGVDAPFSHPDTNSPVLSRLLIPAGYGGPISEYYCTSIWHDAKGWVHEFEYEYAFTNYHEFWNEKGGEIYWLGVQATYSLGYDPSNAWGWATTDPKHHWNDDAVRGTPGWPIEHWEELFYDNEWPGHFHGSDSIDVAFEILTDVIGRRARKWYQPPDMETGEDMASFVPQGKQGETGWPHRADDFVSDGRRITDIHWWGSYIGWETNKPGPVEPPTLPGSPFYNVIGFWLSWHADVPTNGVEQTYSTPSNPPLKKLYVPIDKCHEVYYGTVFQYWKTPPEYEHEYQYYVDLLDTEIDDSGAWYETNGVVYWLDIQAVLTNNWDEFGAKHKGWGWKTTHTNYQWNDVSVVATASNLPPKVGPNWQPGAYTSGPPAHPLVDGKMDLAFELTTDEVGTNRWSTPIKIVSIEDNAADDFEIESIGDWGAGWQYLQWNTNLMSTNWVDVVTNTSPLEPPFTNLWIRPAVARSNEAFRVLQR